MLRFSYVTQEEPVVNVIQHDGCHINTIATKASKTLGLLRRHLKHCTPKVKEIACRTLVRPQMEYCSSVWDLYEKGDVAALEKVQRRAARFVKGDYKRESSVKQMICDLGWQSLEARRAVSRLSLMYKVAHGLVDVESQILVRSGRATRQSQGQHYRNILALKSCYRASFFHALSQSGIICPLIFGMLLLLTALSPPSCTTKTLTI